MQHCLDSGRLSQLVLPEGVLHGQPRSRPRSRRDRALAAAVNALLLRCARRDPRSAAGTPSPTRCAQAGARDRPWVARVAAPMGGAASWRRRRVTTPRLPLVPGHTATPSRKSTARAGAVCDLAGSEAWFRMVAALRRSGVRRCSFFFSPLLYTFTGPPTDEGRLGLNLVRSEVFIYCIFSAL